MRQLISFYEGPDYAAYKDVVERIESKASPSARDMAAFNKIMNSYPLKAYEEALSRSGQMFAADEEFVGAAMKCSSEQIEALAAAGLKSD